MATNLVKANKGKDADKPKAYDANAEDFQHFDATIAKFKADKANAKTSAEARNDGARLVYLSAAWSMANVENFTATHAFEQVTEANGGNPNPRGNTKANKVAEFNQMGQSARKDWNATRSFWLHREDPNRNGKPFTKALFLEACRLHIDPKVNAEPAAIVQMARDKLAAQAAKKNSLSEKLKGMDDDDAVHGLHLYLWSVIGRSAFRSAAPALMAAATSLDTFVAEDDAAPAQVPAAAE